MVVVAQLVRVAVCGAAGRRFEPGQPPRFKALKKFKAFFVFVRKQKKQNSNKKNPNSKSRTTWNLEFFIGISLKKPNC